MFNTLNGNAILAVNAGPPLLVPKVPDLGTHPSVADHSPVIKVNTSDLLILNALSVAPPIPTVVTVPATKDKTPSSAFHAPTTNRIALLKLGIYSWYEWA
jgi:hypothetical protein